MRRKSVIGVIAILTVAGLGIGYLSAAGTLTSMTSIKNTSVTTTNPVNVTATTYTGNQVPNVPFPFKYALFMVPPDLPEFPGCAGGFCFDTNWGEAILFDCPDAVTHGCTVNIYNTHDKANYSIVASSFPQVGQPNEPSWANCSYTTYALSSVPGTPPELYGIGGFFGYCIPVGSGSFIISIYEPCPSIDCSGADH